MLANLLNVVEIFFDFNDVVVKSIVCDWTCHFDSLADDCSVLVGNDSGIQCGNLIILFSRFLKQTMLI